MCHPRHRSSFFFNETAPTETYTLSLHDALPISHVCDTGGMRRSWLKGVAKVTKRYLIAVAAHNLDRILRKLFGVGKRSEEHTSELQSHSDLVCRLLLEKKKIKTQTSKTAIERRL